MKYIFTLLLLLSFILIGFAQKTYEGEVILPGQKLFSRFQVEDQLVSLSVPIQGVKDLAADSSKVTQDSLIAVWKVLNATYKGKFQNDSIIGSLNQHGFTFTFNLVHVKAPTFVGKPQEPRPPFSYIEEEVKVWQEKDSIHLAGTLTLPKSGDSFPVAILISGSGPQDRNSTLVGHKPFLVISDHLTSRGIAVLRMDDRGVAKSEGDFESATSYDFKNDIQAGFNFLKEHKKIDPEKIGLIGHSEGGLVGPLVAADNPNIAFLVMLAGPGVTGAEILIDQNRVIFSNSGLKDEGLDTFEKHFTNIVNGRVSTKDLKTFEKDIEREVDQMFAALKPGQRSFFLGDPKKYSEALFDFLKTDWTYGFLAADPQQYLSKVQCSVLALNGALDVQVTPKINLTGIEQIFSLNKNPDFTIKEYPALNHLFQTSKTGMPAEYGPNEETFNIEVLDDITDWITERFLKN